MDRKEIIELLNSDLHENIKIQDCFYRGKAYILANHTIKEVYKTKRGAEGYIKKNEHFSYYDDYTQELIYPYVNLKIFEIKESEVVNYKKSKTIWYKYLKSIENDIRMRFRAKNLAQEYLKANKELLNYVLNCLEDINNGKKLEVYEEVKEDITAIKEPNIETSEEETKQDIQVTINFNTDKNGIELSFTDRPSQNILEQLKINGFRWSKFQKIWFAKETEERKKFLKEIGFLKDDTAVTTITEEEKNIDLPEIDINDIDTYTISKELSNRENNNSMFRKNNKNHTEELQKTLQNANDIVIDLLKNNTSDYIEYKAKKYLQSYKKKYYELYKSVLVHKANNPSWMVTGRSGLNTRRYNKKQEQLNNKYLALNELNEKFNNKIDNFIDQIEKEKKEKFNNEVAKVEVKQEFKRARLEININAINTSIYDSTNGRMIKVTGHQYKDYTIIKNWGTFRIYNKEGFEVAAVKTTETLTDAKKLLLYILENKKIA